MCVMKKKKANWVDELLEQPANQQEQTDGSILYGNTEEPKFFSQAYWLNIKNALSMVWAAKNPFNEHRRIFKTGMPLVHPNAYRIFFPFSYIGGLIRDIIHPNEHETRANAWYRFWGSSLGELILLCLFGLIVTGLAILFLYLTGKI